jgi:probable rRNA maturation factor
VVVVEVQNRTGGPVPADEAVALARDALAAEGIEGGDLGLHFVGPDEMRSLKREHLGIDETTDVLSFPIDGSEPVAGELPRQLGDIVLCPAVVGDAWRAPLVHGVLHLLGYDHGEEMEAHEKAIATASAESLARASRAAPGAGPEVTI